MEALWQAWWVIWLVPLFLAWELGALALRRPDLTLSWHLWRWFSVKESRPLWLPRRVTLWALCLTLAAHIAGGITVVPLVVAAVPAVLVIGYSVLFERHLNRRPAQRGRQAGQGRRSLEGRRR